MCDGADEGWLVLELVGADWSPNDWPGNVRYNVNVSFDGGTRMASGDGRWAGASV